MLIDFPATYNIIAWENMSTSSIVLIWPTIGLSLVVYYWVYFLLLLRVLLMNILEDSIKKMTYWNLFLDIYAVN